MYRGILLLEKLQVLSVLSEDDLLYLLPYVHTFIPLFSVRALMTFQDPYGSNDMPYNLQTSPGAINPYYILRRNIDLNIPPPARIAPIRVAQRADGVKKYTACISFEVEGRKKAPTIAELLHKHVVLVDKDEEVWVTRKVKTESITWIFDVRVFRFFISRSLADTCDTEISGLDST